MRRYAELVYNGFWFSPERLALQKAIDHTQQFATGTVRLKLYKVRAPMLPSLCQWGADSSNQWHECFSPPLPCSHAAGPSQHA